MSHRPPDVTGKTATPYDKAILLEWDAPTDSSVIGHKYQINPSPEDGSHKWITQSIPSSGYGERHQNWVYIDGLDNGRRYEMLATAINYDGFSEAAKPVHATPIPVPAVVTGFQVTAVDGGALLQWDAPTDASIEFCKVLMSPPAGKDKGYAILTVPDSGYGESSEGGFLVDGLTNGELYVFTVYAANRSGLGFRAEPWYAIPGENEEDRESGIPWVGFPSSLPDSDDDDDDDDDPDAPPSSAPGLPGAHTLPGFPGIPLFLLPPPPDYSVPHYIDEDYDPCEEEDGDTDTNPHPGDNGGDD